VKSGLKNPAVKWFLAGLGSALFVAVLVLVFLAYQHPGLLLDWTNISYCG
jgi:hypothetical protein